MTVRRCAASAGAPRRRAGSRGQPTEAGSTAAASREQGGLRRAEAKAEAPRRMRECSVGGRRLLECGVWDYGLDLDARVISYGTRWCTDVEQALGRVRWAGPSPSPSACLPASTSPAIPKLPRLFPPFLPMTGRILH